ncbi:LacI family DNA-binding transcriptional regulator [Actinomadura rugatobispora]|uniref:LacI family DNA-binding transcriptional regulator n=1 Tax=Actinomadura rugatobispora TaxID=1994 RepID=A0ABW0ZVW3_9ACTN
MAAERDAGGRRSATIKDVAAAAGVGIATVSRVFSGTGSVSPATRERVQAAARELDYRPSALGRGLKLRRSGGIGLIVPDVTDPFRADLVAGVLACARTFGEHVILDAAHGDPAREAEIVDRLVEQRVDGIIAVPAGTEAAWRAPAGIGASVVFADRVPPGLREIPAVLADDRAGVRTLTEYLVGLGHRRIAFLGAAPASPGGDRPAPAAPGEEDRAGPPAQVRERAFRDTMAALGAGVDEDLVVAARHERDSAFAAAAGLLQRRGDVTAVLAAGHLLGEAAVLVARELDLRVPADVSIAMVDDVPWAELCDPPLTTVARPGHDIGYRACELLLRDRTRRTRRGPVLLPAELVIRGSCGPPRPARSPARPA